MTRFDWLMAAVTVASSIWIVGAFIEALPAATATQEVLL